MNKHLTLALAAFFVAGSALAQDSIPQGSPEANPPVVESLGPNQGQDADVQPVGRSREQVRAELACAQASGELAAMQGEAYDPLQAQAARAQGADLPACQALESERGR